jgi:hypothetical protein
MSLLSGCGSATRSSTASVQQSTGAGPTPATLTRAQLVGKADVVCAVTGKALLAIKGATPDALYQRASVFSGAYAQLAALSPPADMTATYQLLVSDYHQLAVTSSQEAVDLGNSNPVGLRADLAQDSLTTGEEAGIVRTLGLNC